MLSKNKIKYLKSLNIKKYRSMENKIVLEGFRLVKEALNQKINFEFIWINETIKNTPKAI